MAEASGRVLPAGGLQSPPYVSNVPDVRHIPLSPAVGNRRAHALLLCSDGLPDLYAGRFASRADTIAHWVQAVGGAVDSGMENPALTLLRDALGGDDVRKVSQYLTVEMDERWMDDVTILVQAI